MTYTEGVMPDQLQQGDVIGVVPYRDATNPRGWARIDISWVGLQVVSPPILAPQYANAQITLWAGTRMTVPWSTLVPVRRDGDDPNPPPVDDTGIPQYLYMDVPVDQLQQNDGLFIAAPQGGTFVPYQAKTIDTCNAAQYAVLPLGDYTPTPIKALTQFSIARPNPAYPWPPADPTPPDAVAADSAPPNQVAADATE